MNIKALIFSFMDYMTRPDDLIYDGERYYTIDDQYKTYWGQNNWGCWGHYWFSYLNWPPAPTLKDFSIKKISK
jgi:hypothetical protein